MVLFLALPLSLTMTWFYIWTMSALTATMQHLESRRQGVKLLMYKRLWYILCASLALIFVMFVVNSVNMSHRRDPEWIANQWKWRWMLLDGSLNLIYLCSFTGIAFLWMPTSNNDRYGLDQLPSDDPDDAYAVLDHEEGIKLRSVKGQRDGAADELEHLDEEDILQWAEAEFEDMDEMTPANSNDKLT